MAGGLPFAGVVPGMPPPTSGMGSLMMSAGPPGAGQALPQQQLGMMPGVPVGMSVLPTGPSLPAGVPPPPGLDNNTQDAQDTEFTTFMTAFRDEMQQTRTFEQRTNKFVPSRACGKVAEDEARARAQVRADEIFGPSQGGGFGLGDEEDDSEDLEWPDELMILGIEMDAAGEGTTSTTTSTTTTTESDTAESEGDDDEADAWPIELMLLE